MKQSVANSNAYKHGHVYVCYVQSYLLFAWVWITASQIVIFHQTIITIPGENLEYWHSHKKFSNIEL